MKILITGVNGQVGHALIRELTEHELIGLTRQDCDLTNLDQIRQIIDQHQPDLIINPAAYTKVDQAEEEPELAFKINRDAPRVMAEKAREYNIPFIHFSTDYVFDGKKEDTYNENDQTNPMGVYGRSKLEGEEAIKEVGGFFYIFRTSWVYSNIGHNFYLTMKNLSQEKNELRVVGDQCGTPTSNVFIARQIKKIIPQLSINNVGTYHLVPEGFCSWHDFARAIIKKANPEFDLQHLIKIKALDYPTRAIRPNNSRLFNEKIKQTFMLEFDGWQSELDRIIDES
jgi:dTDP-4-dehydrorhamnose reductase